MALQAIAKDAATPAQLKAVADNAKIALETDIAGKTAEQKTEILNKVTALTGVTEAETATEVTSEESAVSSQEMSQESSQVAEASSATEATTAEETTASSTTADESSKKESTAPAAKPAEKKPQESTTKPKQETSTTKQESSAPKKEKVWVEPVYKTEDVYEEVEETYYETVTKTVTEKVLVTPAREEKKEKWQVGYDLYFYDNYKAYTADDSARHARELILAGVDDGYTSEIEVIEGPLTFDADWKKDISEVVKVEAVYKDVQKEVTEKVPKTRTVKKKVGTKQVLVKEGYWKEKP